MPTLGISASQNTKSFLAPPAPVDPNVFVALDQWYTDVTATSTDGITWTARTLPEAADWISVAWGD